MCVCVCVCVCVRVKGREEMSDSSLEEVQVYTNRVEALSW